MKSLIIDRGLATSALERGGTCRWGVGFVGDMRFDADPVKWMRVEVMCFQGLVWITRLAAEFCILEPLQGFALNSEEDPIAILKCIIYYLTKMSSFSVGEDLHRSTTSAGRKTRRHEGDYIKGILHPTILIHSFKWCSLFKIKWNLYLYCLSRFERSISSELLLMVLLLT